MADTSKKKSVAFLTLGCKVNTYETEAMQELLVGAGYEIVDFSEVADIYIVNTCTVTNIADRKSRQMLHKAKKKNQNAIVVAAGCYAQASNDVLEEDLAIDIIIGNNKKKDIVTLLNEYYANHDNKEAIININKEQEYEELKISSLTEKNRAYIKIQDGCNQFCSYCIIPYTRGRVRSRKEEDVIEEVKRLVANGYKEVVLTGIHLSSYGIELKPLEKINQTEDYLKEEAMPLLRIVMKLSEIEGLERIRLGSLEPRIITEYFAKTLSKNSKFCPHFHLSLQSGCDATLKRMNRKYTTKEYYESCLLLRKYFKHPAITTDVIVGFPGETQEEFEETKEFLKKVSFAQMHVFKYSVRKGTRAESMPNQVPDEVKAHRSSELIQRNEAMNYEYQNQFLGKIEKILVEEEIKIDGKMYQIGHNERYVKLAFSSEISYVNQVVEAKVMEERKKEMLLCEIID